MTFTPSFPKNLAEGVARPESAQHQDAPQQPTVAQLLAHMSQAERQKLIASVFADDIKALIKKETDLGYKQGYEAGLEDAEKTVDQQLKEQKALLTEQQHTLSQLIDNWDLTEIMVDSIPISQMYSWAVKACYQVLLCELQEPQLLTRQLTTLMKETVAEQDIIVEVHSAQAEMMKAAVLLHPTIRQVVSNDTLNAGEIRLRLGHGEILSSLPTRIAQLQQLILEQVNRWTSLKGTD